MRKFTPHHYSVKLDKIIQGGQALGTLEDGKKIFVWGALPGETASVTTTHEKSHYAEAVADNIDQPNPKLRVTPRDPDSYLATSPWQIMSPEAEQHFKAALIEEAFEPYDIVLPEPIEVYSDDKSYEYRNKIEYSFWYDTEHNTLDLAFFQRGTHRKQPVKNTSLAVPAINTLAQSILNILSEHHVGGHSLKTLLIRANQTGNTTWQLYLKDEAVARNTALINDLARLNRLNGELIYSNPKSPASVITKHLWRQSDNTLQDKLLNTTFSYATEGFFQINLPVYEQALRDMQPWVLTNQPLLDLYSGVGTIGLTIASPEQPLTLVEINSNAVAEMRRNIATLGRAQAQAVETSSEQALDYIATDQTVVVDPPRAGLHTDVTQRLLDVTPQRIIYLSCNPVTQARDVAALLEKYHILYHRGYNFFPRTPHIEHLIVLEKN